MPYNWKSPFGYILTLAYEDFMLRSGITYFLSPFICFLIGSCFLVKAFIEDVTNDLSSLNVSRTSTSGFEDRLARIEISFGNVVHYHSHVKQLSMVFSSQRV